MATELQPVSLERFTFVYIYVYTCDYHEIHSIDRLVSSYACVSLFIFVYLYLSLCLYMTYKSQKENSHLIRPSRIRVARLLRRESSVAWKRNRLRYLQVTEIRNDENIRKIKNIHKIDDRRSQRIHLAATMKISLDEDFGPAVHLRRSQLIVDGYIVAMLHSPIR